MYVSEVRELIDSILFRIERLEAARVEWLKHSAIANTEARVPPAEFSHDTFAQALNAAAGQHTVMFDEFEALFAAWARLSLLFYPIPSKGEEGTWRGERGVALRRLLELPEESLLANREFRDAWMHFDERLDKAYQEGWLGNRQQFVRSSGVDGAKEHSVRVIDIEGLAFHYRAKNGAKQTVGLAKMKELLISMNQSLATVGPRIMRLFPRPSSPEQPGS